MELFLDVGGLGKFIDSNVNDTTLALFVTDALWIINRKINEATFSFTLWQNSFFNTYNFHITNNKWNCWCNELSKRGNLTYDKLVPRSEYLLHSTLLNIWSVFCDYYIPLLFLPYFILSPGVFVCCPPTWLVFLLVCSRDFFPRRFLPKTWRSFISQLNLQNFTLASPFNTFQPSSFPIVHVSHT